MEKSKRINKKAFEASVEETVEIIQAFRRKRSKNEDISIELEKDKLKNLLRKKGEEIELRSFSSSYEIFDSVGHGGMKEVFEAKDLQAMRRIAYAKIRQGKETALNTRRFIREARITALLEHPNIIPIHDVGVDDLGKPYFTMKYLEGESLQEVLNKLHCGEPSYLKKYSPQRLLEIYMDCCRAVAYAHSKGVLHLDLKPSNIHLSQFGEVLVLDWGISSFLGDIQKKEELEEIPDLPEVSTLSGTLKGTPGFMAPEQIEPALAEINEQTDLYQLGCLLYSILVYVPPIQKESIQDTLKATLNGEVESLFAFNHKVPPALEAVVQKAMSIHQQGRYHRVIDLIKDIQSHQDGYSTSAWKASLWDLGLLAFHRHRGKVLVGVVFSSVVMFITIIFMVELVKSNRKARKAQMEAEVLNEEVTKALKVARENEALAMQKAEEALRSDRQYHDLKDGVEHSFEIAREKLPEVLANNMRNLRDSRGLASIKFLMENDYRSFLKFPYDAVWMLCENESIKKTRFDQLVNAIRQNPDLDLEVFDRVVDIVSRMRFERKRVPVEECSLVLEILRSHVEIEPNFMPAYVMKDYHERYLLDPTYPTYIENLFKRVSIEKEMKGRDVHNLEISVGENGWMLKMTSSMRAINLSLLSFLPVYSFEAKGCWAKDYTPILTWPVKILSLKDSNFKIGTEWKVERFQLKELHLDQCPLMNWPRLVDMLPAKKIFVPKDAAEYLNAKYMESHGVELKLK